MLDGFLTGRCVNSQQGLPSQESIPGPTGTAGPFCKPDHLEGQLRWDGPAPRSCISGGTLGHVIKRCPSWGAGLAQSIKHLTSAQVTISGSVSFERRVGLCADSSEPGACLGFCVFLSLRPSPAHALSLSLSLKNK